MSNIHSILPLLDDSSWRWDKQLLTEQRIRPGSDKDLFSNPTYPGFVYFGSISVSGESGPSASIEVGFDKANVERSIGRLYQSGISGGSGIAPGISRFDTENDVYVAELSPNIPISYLDNANISIHAPQDDSVLVDAFGIKLDILDLELFSQSFQRVTSGEIIDRMQEVRDRTEEVGEKLDDLNANIEALGELMEQNRAGIR